MIIFFIAMSFLIVTAISLAARKQSTAKITFVLFWICYMFVAVKGLAPQVLAWSLKYSIWAFF